MSLKKILQRQKELNQTQAIVYREANYGGDIKG